MAHVARIFDLLGETQEQAAKDAATVLKMETALARYSLSNVERRDPASLYHMMSLAKFDSAVSTSVDFCAPCKRRRWNR